jgi:hypothetical protein
MTRLQTVVLLAAPQPGDYDPSTGKGPEWGKAAPIGLLVILLLGIAMFFLLRSFTRQLKKVPATFEIDTDLHTDTDTVADTVAGNLPASAGPVTRVSTAKRAGGITAPPGGTESGPDGRADQTG